MCTWEFDNECLDHDGTLENNCVEELKTLSTLLTPSQFAELPDDVDPNKLVTIGYLPVCGDGVVWREQDAREMCDDGNTINGDGCNSRCQIEDLFSAGGSLASDTISGQPLGLGR